MRTLYITVAVLCLTAILLLILAFFYIDWQKHAVYHYTVSVDGHPAGSIKIDKFATEDKLIYRSESDTPFYPVFTESRSRITFDKNGLMENYSREDTGAGARQDIYMEKDEDTLSSLSRFRSEFLFADRIPVKKEAIVFEDDSPVTYLSLIEKYDFRRGRSQVINAVSPIMPDLPPMKRLVTMTSIRDEYLKVDSRSIKTECLWVKIKSFPQVTLWVSKYDRSPVALEIPSKGIRITRNFHPKTPDAGEIALDSREYTSRDVSFKNRGLLLAGTMTVPAKEGRHAGVLLIPGDGQQDRQYEGIFTYIADHLAKKGFCVLRFDRRGIGASAGDSAASADSDEESDLNAALEYLAAQKEVDPERIGVIAHAEGAVRAAQLASKNPMVKTAVLMSPATKAQINLNTDAGDLARLAADAKWSEEYYKLALRTNLETANRLRSTAKDWIYLLRRRCFLKKMRERAGQNPVAIIKEMIGPVLILQCRESARSAAVSDKPPDTTPDPDGGRKRILVCFGYLDRFLGKRIVDGVHRIHYRPDPEVLSAMEKWLEANLAAAPAPAPAVQPEG
jgi:pimeloyl-ACP methyl ester carboxylesterase